MEMSRPRVERGLASAVLSLVRLPGVTVLSLHESPAPGAARALVPPGDPVSTTPRVTYVYMTVDYTEPPTAEADAEAQERVRATYKGVRLEVQYGRSRPEVTKVFMSGEFADDYNAAVAWAMAEMGESEVPFMGSSSVDHYMYDAG